MDQNKLLQNIIDLLPVRIFWKDADLKYIGCNKAFAQDAGMNSPAEIVGKDDFQMGWKEQADSYRADDMEVIQSGVSKINYEEPQTTPAGEKIWLITNKVPLKDGEGKIYGILGTYLDISDKKKNEQDLKKNMEELQKLNGFMTNRELKMIELKKKNEELQRKLDSGAAR